MSGSEGGGNVGINGVVPHPHHPRLQPHLPNSGLSFSPDAAAVHPSSLPPPAVDASGEPPPPSAPETGKRKRGRPRKYGPDAGMAISLRPSQPNAAAPPPPSTSPRIPSTLKRARGRPPGSTKKRQLDALASTGLGFTPHVITVQAGEDVSSKIVPFSQQGPRAVCILSANGAISNVTLHQAATSGRSVTYEGRFEILSLSGSFALSEIGGPRIRTGGLSVSLSGPDGRVVGGSVAGPLTAASPVQVVVGSFIADGGKDAEHVIQMELPSTAAKLPSSGTGPGPGAGPSSPPSHGTLNESSGGTNSPLNQSKGGCNNTQSMSSMPWQ